MFSPRPPIKVVQKGWGYEIFIANSSMYCGKLLHFNAGKKCSMHYHLKKTETFFLHSGMILLRRKALGVATEDVLIPGDKVDITPGVQHQMIALEDSDLFEFSTEDFDSDSYRTEPGDSQIAT